jgi:hypothetical protein
MRQLTIPAALVLALAVSANEASPSPKGPAGSKPTVTKVQTQKSGATKPSTVKASTSKGSTPKGTSQAGSKPVKSTQTSPKLASDAQSKGSGSKSLKSTKSETTVAKTDKAVKAQGTQAKAEEKRSRTSTNSSVTTTTTTSGTSTRLIDFTATGVGQKLQKNSALRSKIEAKLQAAGYTGTAYEAAYGFKNVGQLNAATNLVQNQGTSFELLKVLMTGTYVDPVTHNVYRTQKLPDGTTQLVKPELATNTASTLSLGQAKQAISGGSVMPVIVPYTATSTPTTTSTSAGK